MISMDLARALRDAGLVWHPRSGDRFQLNEPEFEADVFTVSEMTIEPRRYSTGTILAFNGTTEWALDSVALDDALWLPREDQLRALIGDRLESLQRTPDGWTVTYRTDTTGGGAGSVTHTDPEEAYAAALLDIAGAFTPSE